MTPREAAVLRDRVARAKLKQDEERAAVKRSGGYKNWSPERNQAGDEMLARLRAAEARTKARRRTVAPPAPVLRLRCVYCGMGVRLSDQSKKKGAPAVCPEHRDLPLLDPYYAEVFA